MCVLCCALAKERLCLALCIVEGKVCPVLYVGEGKMCLVFCIVDGKMRPALHGIHGEAWNTLEPFGLSAH